MIDIQSFLWVQGSEEYDGVLCQFASTTRRSTPSIHGPFTVNDVSPPGERLATLPAFSLTSPDKEESAGCCYAPRQDCGRIVKLFEAIPDVHRVGPAIREIISYRPSLGGQSLPAGKAAG